MDLTRRWSGALLFPALSLPFRSFPFAPFVSLPFLPSCAVPARFPLSSFTIVCRCLCFILAVSLLSAPEMLSEPWIPQVIHIPEQTRGEVALVQDLPIELPAKSTDHMTPD